MHPFGRTPGGKGVKSLFEAYGVYTQRYNRAHGCDGPLFRGRYRAILVEADTYLLQVLKYIHRNPLRAGVVKNLEAYEWSSHRGYLSLGRRWNWLYKEFILGLLQKEKGSRLEAYHRFVGEEDGADILRIFEGQKWPSILGGAGFVREVKERFFARLQYPEVSESGVLAPAAEEIIKVVCKTYGVGKDELLRSRRGRFNEARNVAIYLIRELRRATLDNICGPFRMGRYSSASSAIDRVKVQLARDRRLEKRMQKIIGELYKRQT